MNAQLDSGRTDSMMTPQGPGDEPEVKTQLSVFRCGTLVTERFFSEFVICSVMQVLEDAALERHCQVPSSHSSSEPEQRANYFLNYR